jgi:MarR family transcriptional regulator, organic hydroperoxide resistance regulator
MADPDGHLRPRQGRRHSGQRRLQAASRRSKLLEKKGLLRRRPSPTDARVVRLSLADKTQKHIASLNEQYKTIREFVFQGFDEDELTEFTGKLATLKNRLQKACVRISIDF